VGVTEMRDEGYFFQKPKETEALKHIKLNVGRKNLQRRGKRG
jgi:hypothetical protein